LQVPCGATTPEYAITKTKKGHGSSTKPLFFPVRAQL
jgi:hypothetical protein